MQTRPATIADIPEMHRIRLAVRENRLVSVTLTPEDYVRHLDGSWVAIVDDRIAGFASADLATANVWALFVDPAFERKGIGRALHDEVIRWMADVGLARAWLTTGAGTRAEHFYRAAGWVATATLPSGELRFELGLVAR